MKLEEKHPTLELKCDIPESVPGDCVHDASNEEPAQRQINGGNRPVQPVVEVDAETDVDHFAESLHTSSAPSKQTESDRYTMPRLPNSLEGRAKWRQEFKRKFRVLLFDELRDHAVPLAILLGLLLFPKLLIIWIPTVLLWSGCEAVYRRLTPTGQQRLKQTIPPRWIASKVFRELRDGMGQIRPFILASLYLCCVPVAVVWMSIHWLRSLNRDSKPKQSTCSEDLVSFLVNKRQPEEDQSNFFHSPAFAVTCLFLFGSGLPALLTYGLYQSLGIDAILGFPSHDPAFQRIFVTKGLYFFSIAWCACVLFMRSWFIFPLNFVGDEQTVELNEHGIRRHDHSWFSQVLTCNNPGAGAPSLQWQTVTALRMDLSTSPFYPLPKSAFPADSFLYTVLNKLALLVDGVTQAARRDKYIYFTTDAVESNNCRRIDDVEVCQMPLDLPNIICNEFRAGSGFARSIRLKLSDLDADERARLYYAVRKWAPHVVIDQVVQENIIGSAALHAPCYTQLWFELLTDKMRVKRTGLLPPGTALHDGALTVKEHISSGGQANIYAANRSDGSEVVLKEYILSTSNAVGALVESAGEFETEASLLSSLEHPRIVKMHDCFAEDRRLYIVLEKVEGMSLRQRVKSQGRLEPEEVAVLAIEVCDVLEYLQAKQPPVVHRDIAPDNLMFNKEHGVKVIDFSVAAAKISRRTTSTMGKHSYAPPEQFREQPCPQSDIYALGATMFFLLTGEDPKPISVSDVRSKREDVPEKLVSIIRQATAFSLEDRFSSASWLKLELEAFLTGSQT